MIRRIRLTSLKFATLVPIAAMLAVPSAEAGQEQQQPPATASAPTQDTTQDATPAQRVAVRTELVLVPVIVTDKNGKPVKRLPKEAFRVEESGKPQMISLFEETQTQKLVAFPAASATSAANFLTQDSRLRLTIVVIDTVNTPWLRQLEGKKQLIEYLLHATNQGEPIALFGLTMSGLRQLHPFTTDPKVLAAALQKLKLSLSLQEGTQPATTLTDDPAVENQAASESELLSEMLKDLQDTVAADYQRIAARQTLAALKQFARALGSTPGRKTLIWATAGFPFTIDDPSSFARQGDDLKTEYEQTWRALNSANIAVYPVDIGSADIKAASLPSARSTVSNSQINAITGTTGIRSPLNLPYDEGEQQRLTMHAFADATGGRACITIAEIEKCFAQAVDDARQYYLLGYYLSGDTQPGWRKLKVKVAGDGLRVRSRNGFYVGKKEPETAAARRQEIVDALAAVVQYTGVRLTARLKAEDGASGNATNPPGQKKTVEFVLGVMGESLTVDREKNNAIDLEIAALAFDERRQSVASSSQTLATNLTPELWQKIQASGMGLPEKLEMVPGKYEVKFAVRDNLSGQIGTVSLPVEVQ